ncbi:MAG: protein translocase subunit SecD [Flavobacteriales bacterium]|nr:protein translocase subunit SecD [Flavobacteriales bacterium]MBK7942082.1 protein translocase subunit SecD [Flavobacteriales bacterium]
MQNRGALWIFTILLALACLWQLSFSLFTSRVEREAREQAAYLADSVMAVPGNAMADRDSLMIAMENRVLRDRAEERIYPVFGYSYRECKEKEINLGLDLKGGMAVTLEVSIPELVANLSENSNDATFQAVMTAARARQSSSTEDFITLFADEWNKQAPNAKMAAVFHSADKKDMFPREASNDEIVEALRREARTAINNTENILRNRIDKFGVAQPGIQKQQFSGRIQVELPGVKDKERVRKVLQSTANLEFWETYDNTEVYPLLEAANKRLRDAKGGASTAAETDGAYNKALSTGVSIDGLAGGVESGLLGFLESGRPVDKTTWFNFDRVVFRSGSAELLADSSDAQLNNLAEILKAYPDVRLKIGGYTDSTGNAAANQKLSQQRAEAVVADLEKKGVANGRLEAEGYGSQHPVASNATEEGRAKNRRMALRVLETGAVAAADSSAADSDSGEDLLQALSADSDSAAVDTAGGRAEFQKENPLFAILTPSVFGTQAGGYQLSKGAAVGNARALDTASVNATLRGTSLAGVFPADLRFAWGAKPIEGTDVLTLYALRVPRGGKPKLDGSSIVNAAQDFDMKGDVEVMMQMDAEGAQTWKVMTGDNVGKSIAIVLDELVYSAPTVISEIAGGRSSISMGSGDLNQQIQEADDLANILKAGALPAPARIIDETVVGPSLGKDNVNKGMLSFAIALVMVMLYMWLYYASAGLIADIALAVNLFVLIGSLASLQASLTLPGIAGIVLTMGMAVDANVLIFERVREELRHGKMLKSAVDLGYKGALSAIIDSNVTTFLTAVILYLFGSGPIRGFATTLGLGILTSLFTALFLSRMIMTWRLEQGRTISFWNNWSRNILVDVKVDWMSKRRVFYLISAVIIGVGVFSMVTRGFNLGVDFSGGRTYVVKFEQAVDVEQVRGSLERSFNADGAQSTVNVKSYGGASQVKVVTNYLVNSTGLEADAQVEERLRTGLGGLNNAYEVTESRKVDPTISDDIKTSAFWSVTLALLAIFVYIWIRFNSWQYGLGGLLALAHDALFVLGLYSLLNGIVPFSLEIDEAFIAVILTVIGYSINDTVIVFDRIREYLREHKRDSNIVVFNRAINSTLGRTLNTAATTLLVLLVIFLLGGLSIKGFVFGLFMGILVGTYSSIFIASAATVDLLKERRTAATPVAA